MTIKKLLLLLCLQACVPVFCHAQNGFNTINLIMEDGETASYFMGDNPKIIHEGAFFADKQNHLRIIAQDIDISITAVASVSYSYTENPATGINSLKEEKKDILYDGKSVFFFGNGTDKDVTVVTADGRTVQRSKVAADETKVVDLDGMPSGIYVFSVNGVSFKVVKR